ncbi:hypothetical protein [Shouchella miscanthi]|uniref:hypothetical protein n=1 Tax=Shouchella miscanthi TaxID=2598861 RepID=UPI0011A68F49|nr:hypothetical protein [Shouchella miscanthi]
MKKLFMILVPIICILAFIQILSNIPYFLSAIGGMALFAGMIYLGYRFYLSKRYGVPFKGRTSKGPNRSQIRKAQRTSTVKPQTKKPFSPSVKQRELNQKQLKKVPKRRSSPHLTVIEGKNTKKKKKA